MTKLDRLIDRLKNQDEIRVNDDINAILAQKGGYDFVRDGEFPVAQSRWQSEIPGNIDAASLKHLFYSESWVYICTDLVAQKISAQWMQVMQDVPNEDGKMIAEEMPGHHLNTLMDKPNRYQDWTAFSYACMAELTLEGNAIIWYNKTKNELKLMPTEYVTLEFDRNGDIETYVVGRERQQFSTEQASAIPAEQIIHIRRPNPASIFWGLSPFVPVSKALLFDRNTMDYLNAFYLKQATPALAVTMDRAVNEEVAIRQLRSFENAYGGRANARRTLLLPKGVGVQPLSHSISDQKLLDHVMANRQVILATLKIPPHEVGMQAGGSLGSEEYKTALVNFWDATLIPSMRMFAGEMTRFFRANGQMLANEYFEFDLSEVEVLRSNKEKHAALGQAYLASGWTVNEVREFYDLPASELAKADEPYPLASTAQPTPFAQFAAMPEPAMSSEPHTKQADPAYTKAIDGYLQKNGTSLASYMKAAADEEERTAGRFTAFMLDLFTEIAGISAEAVLAEDKSKAMSESQRRVRDRIRKRIERAFKRMEKSYLEDYSTILEGTVDFGFQSQVPFVFNAPDAPSSAAINERLQSGKRAILEARGIASFASISKTHTERIMARVSQGIENNEDTRTLAQGIASELGDAGTMLAKAQTIARTETLTASSQGQWAATEVAVEVLGAQNLRKQWINAGDARVRDQHIVHQEAGPQELSYEYAASLKYPREPGAAADEVINCRCSYITIPAADADAFEVEPTPFEQGS